MDKKVRVVAQCSRLADALREVLESHGNGDRARVEEVLRRIDLGDDLETDSLVESLVEAFEGAAQSLLRAQRVDEAGGTGIGQTREDAESVWASRQLGMLDALVNLCSLAGREDLAVRFRRALDDARARH